MRLTTTLTAMLLALPLGAFAQDHPPGPPQGGDHQGPPPGARGPGMMLERLDQILSIAEAKDDDKEVNERLKHWEETVKEKNPEEFKKLDTDGDGHLSRAEARAAAERIQGLLKEKSPDLFAKLDANGDGRISRDEAHAALQRFHEEHPPGDHPPGDHPPGEHPPGHGDDAREPGVDQDQERRRRGEGQ